MAAKHGKPVGNEFVYDGVPGTHQWYDGTQHPWEFKRVWHLEPSLTDPEMVYAGAEDASLFQTTDGGKTWKELPGLRRAKGNLWQPGAGGMCLHTILLDPKISQAASLSPFPQLAPFGATIRGRPGNQSIAALNHPSNFQTQLLKLDIACIESPCTDRSPAFFSCRNIGM